MPISTGTFVVDRDQPPLSAEDAETVARFHELYYRRWIRERGDTISANWFGFETLKCPLDLWIYQELLVRTRPDVVIETGTFRGGSALYLASILDLIGAGRVISVDIDANPARPEHRRIAYVEGSSTSPDVVARVRDLAGGGRAMVVLDSDHREPHVYEEMFAYGPMVPLGGYLVVEDTNVNGHPAYPEFGPGPMEAVERYLAEHDDFEPDPRCERFLMTLNPRGYLKRVRA